MYAVYFLSTKVARGRLHVEGFYTFPQPLNEDITTFTIFPQCVFVLSY